MSHLVIETPRLVVRSFSPIDAGAFMEFSRQPSVAHWLPDMVVQDESEAAGWIGWINRNLDATKPFVILAIEEKASHALLGFVGAGPKEELNNEIEVAYGIADPYQGKGFATEAAQALIEWVFANTALERLSAIVQPANWASTRVIDKLGFTYIDTRELPHEGEVRLFDYYRLKRGE